MIMLCFHGGDSPVLPKYHGIDTGDYAVQVRHIMSYQRGVDRKKGEEMLDG
ncbi:hypothetical protein JNE141411_45990 [Escherichia coli]|nr:hypothetical protein TUM18781_41930 [Escherichia coli]BDW67004.1 hypothetical protein JNE141411_45990 [Escherichia coli]